jgi:hypothetical protein
MSKIIEKDQCQICVSERVKRSMITCPKCNLLCCQGCIKKFLLDSPLQTPTCMGCKVGLDLDFVVSNMDPSFDDAYRLHRAKIVLSLEKSLIPGTQAEALGEAKRREHNAFTTTSNSNIRKLRKWIREAEAKKEKYLEKSSKYKIVDKDIERAEKYMSKYTEISGKIQECRCTILKIRDSLEIESRMYSDSIHKKVEVKTVKDEPKYICPCPQQDCKGFIDSVTYKCGMCEKAVCKRCQTPEHEDQKCNPDIVETVKMLQKETKPCPKCRAPIFKIDGCDQIWCTSCHTAFSWNTGEVETGRIHNPHYYQWMRANGGMPREQGDVRGGQCAQDINFGRIMRNTYILCPFIDEINTIDYLTQCHRLIFHIRQVMIRQNDVYDTVIGLENRIRYMLGDFSEKQWLSKLKAREKVKDIKRCQTSLFTMCANTLEDLLNNIRMCRDKEEFQNYFGQLQGLNKYVSDNVLKLKKRFNVKMASFDSVWNLVYL